MRHVTFKKTILLSLVLCGLTACSAEQSEKDLIAEAQFCLDKATNEAAATQCIAPIQSLKSFYAYELKCAAGFISAEITTPANLSKALTAISDSSTSPVVMLAALSFEKGNINTTFDACNSSGQPGLQLIAAMAKSATQLASLAAATGGLASCANDLNACSANLEGTIQNIIDSYSYFYSGSGSGGTLSQEQVEENVGAIVETIQTVYQTTCSGSFNANQDICEQINNSIPAGVDFLNADSPQLVDIGIKLLEQWKQP